MAEMLEETVSAKDTRTAATPPPREDLTEIRVQGQAAWVPSAEVQGRKVIVTGKWLKIASVQDEELTEGEIVAEPASFIKRLQEGGPKADLFTFSQKLPKTTPCFSYHMEWDNLAVIPISSFEEWWEKRVDPGVRRAVRKAAKSGLVTKRAPFDDDFVAGIVSINNEARIRQGRPFWHFQKSFEDVKKENSTYAENNIFLGAYLDGDLVGFMRMTVVDKVAHIIQLLSMMKHYDKRPANALVAKAVEVCSEEGITQLVYCNYVYNDPTSSLTEFKRRNGFEKVLVPRYYVPLSTLGKAVLFLGLHQGLAKRLPQPLVVRLLKIRNRWYSRKSQSADGAN